MGNKITFHPRVLLTQEIALVFRSADLDGDVLKMIEKWRARGAGLAIGLEEFQNVFGTIPEPEKQFALFDTDRDGKIDAHEVFMAAIFLSSADVQRKIETAFAIFDFSGRQGSGEGSINFEEAMIIMQACSRGLLKIAQFDFQIPDGELHYHCKSLFDMHRMDIAAPMNLRQFKEWALADPTPRAFIYLFHHSQGLRDIYAQVTRASDEQTKAFKAAAGGHHHAPAEALKGSAAFRSAIRALSDEEVDSIVDLMLEGNAVTMRRSNGSIKSAIGTSRFQAVLRPWNIFNELDLDGNGTLDEKDIEALLWALSGQRPTAEDVNSLSKLAGAYSDGGIDRSTWLEAVMSQQDGRPPHFKMKHVYANVRRTRASVTSIAPIPDRQASRMSMLSSPSSPDEDRRRMILSR